MVKSHAVYILLNLRIYTVGIVLYGIGMLLFNVVD